MLAWPLLCSLFGLASVAVWRSGAGPGLAWHAATWMQDPLALWTASLAHRSGAHLLANLLPLLALAVLGVALRVGRPSAIALLAAWPLGTLALSAWPQISAYSGMAGVLNAMVAILWLHAVFQHRRTVALVLFGALLVKMLGEQAWARPVAFDPNWGFNVVYAAHLAGALTGTFCGLLAQAFAARPKPAL